MSSKLVKETFLLKLAPDLERELPIVTLSGTNKEIASFVMLGDVELNHKCAKLLIDKIRSKGLLEAFDMVVAIEAKGIALTHECAYILNLPYYVVIRKALKKYMVQPITVPVESITSFGEQTIVLNGLDAERIQGKRVCIIEDVIATGGSVRAACKLIKKAGGEVTVIATVLVKGGFDDPRLVYYHKPPI
ncbi:MAG: adenine phosphoribosyltransferase [Deltaproteobacteria bacterium]|nr:adenine phosphoribosyltransferase [Deltaproteobacteria bacterium]